MTVLWERRDGSLGGGFPYVPVLRQEALVASFPGKGGAAVAEHTVGDLGPDVESEDVLELKVRTVGEPAHLVDQRHPCRLLEGGEELDGFETDLRPGQLGGAQEHLCTNFCD